MSRTSQILAPLAAALVLGLAAGQSFGQAAVIIGPPTVTPIYTSASPISYAAPSSISYYAAPTPVVAVPTPVPSVVTTYYAPALLPRREVVTSYYYTPGPVATYSSTQVVVRPRVVRYYYSAPVYIYP